MSDQKERGFQDFKLGKRLGNGGFGYVVSATSKEDGKIYALKVIIKKNLISKKQKLPIIEAEVLKKLKSDNIVKIIDTFEDKFNFVLILEHVNGCHLKEYVKSKNSPDVCKPIIRQLVNTLSYIHSKNIIHRDIKPENILINVNDELKLCDFGTAKIFDRESIPSRSSFVGSPDYISPEIINNQPQTPSIDLWDLGITLFEIYTGSTPFYTPTKFETYERISKCEYQIPNSVPPDAADLISKLIVLDPASRMGYGEEYEGYKSILSHPFFKDID